MQKILAVFAALFLGAIALADPPEKTKGKPADPLAGYKKRKIEGFTVLISDKVFEANVDKYERKPLEVLELELRRIVNLMSPRAVKALQNVAVWVEWDEIDKKSPGAVAKYYGGSSLWVLEQGKNPLKTNNIEILTMRRLTEVHQPKSNFQQCVLLHEMAHAVHHQLFTYDDPLVKAAYKAAMERGLYQSVKSITGKTTRAYAASNYKEYFAELSCAYLDKGTYFPFTREELKDYDPTGYKLMEVVWSKAENKHKADSKPKAAALAIEDTAKPTGSSEPETPEEEAARKLKLTVATFDGGKVTGADRERFKTSLEKLIKTFPDTKAAKEAKEWVEKLDK
ncbi:MAG: hypothetical protein ACJ8FY_15830 [Gemmataceae bacterium]